MRPVVLTLLAATVVLLGAAPASAQEDETAIHGRLSYREGEEQLGAEDVEIQVEATAAAFSEDVSTDDEGEWQVVVPEPGVYRITIDPDTLPDGVSLRDEDRTTLTVNVQEGQDRVVLFALSTGDEGGGHSTLDRALRLGLEGIRFGLIIAMCSIGLSLIFGTTGLVNFSHGEMVTFGALIAYLFNRTFGIHIVLAGVLALIVGALFGGLYDRSVWRPLRRRGTSLIAMLVISIGIGLLLRYAFLYQFRGARRTYAEYGLQPPSISLGPIDTRPRDLWIIGLSVVLLIGVALFLQRTRVGKAMRAVADDRDLAESSGIDVDRVITTVWIAGGALAAIGGIFQGLSEVVSWQMGFQLLLLIFAATILGGLGTAYGAMVGGLIIGLFIQLSTLVVDTEFKTAAALLVLILALLVRPQGVLGHAERVG